jgi:hypothetical protein
MYDFYTCRDLFQEKYFRFILGLQALFQDTSMPAFEGQKVKIWDLACYSYFFLISIVLWCTYVTVGGEGGAIVQPER